MYLLLLIYYRIHRGPVYGGGGVLAGVQGVRCRLARHEWSAGAQHPQNNNKIIEIIVK